MPSAWSGCSSAFWASTFVGHRSIVNAGHLGLGHYHLFQLHRPHRLRHLRLRCSLASKRWVCSAYRTRSVRQAWMPVVTWPNSVRDICTPWVSLRFLGLNTHAQRWPIWLADYQRPHPLPSPPSAATGSGTPSRTKILNLFLRQVAPRHPDPPSHARASEILPRAAQYPRGQPIMNSRLWNASQCSQPPPRPPSQISFPPSSVYTYKARGATEITCK